MRDRLGQQGIFAKAVYVKDKRNENLEARGGAGREREVDRNVRKMVGHAGCED